MISFSAIWFLLIFVVGVVVPAVMLRKHQRLVCWDYLYPFTGIAIWFPLGMGSVGSVATLANFAFEVFLIAVISIAVPWVRWGFARFGKGRLKGLSFVLTFVPVVAAVVIRLVMPTLPE